jgi:hypothetical protein
MKNLKSKLQRKNIDYRCALDFLYLGIKNSIEEQTTIYARIYNMEISLKNSS